MLLIQNGKSVIRDSDRFVGFAGDNTVNTKQFTMIDFIQENIADSDGGIEHMTKEFFLIGSAVELDDGSEMEYVTPSRLQNSINQAIETVTATVSYVDIDGCPCIYDPEQGIYVRAGYHAGSSNPDGAMSDVCNGVISGATE